MATFSWRRWLKSWFARAPRTLVRRTRRLHLEALEDRVTPTFTWTGLGGSNSWSDPGNWGGTAPSIADINDDFVFPSGPAKTTSFNDLGAGLSVHSITFSGNNYNLSGAPLNFGGSLIASPSTTGNIVGLNLQDTTNEDFNVGTAAILTVSAQISTANSTAPAPILKDGSGTLVLSGNSATFTGGFTVSQGVAEITGNADALGTGLTTVLTNAQLQVNSVAGAIPASLNLSGKGLVNDGVLVNVAGNNTWAGTITLATDVYLDQNAGTSLTITGSITDSGTPDSLFKENPGTLVLSPTGAANSYRGETVIDNGILQIGAAGALPGTGTYQTATIVNSGATLQMSSAAANPFTISNVLLVLNGVGFNAGAGVLGALDNSSGANTWAGNIALGSIPTAGANINVGVAAGSTLTVSGTISDSIDPSTNNVAINAGTGSPYVNNLTKMLGGTLVLTSANTYDGTTTISTGDVTLSDSQGLGTTVGGTTVAAGAALELKLDGKKDSVTGTTTSLNVAEPLALNGTGLAGAGALHSISGVNTYSGLITLASTAALGVEPDPSGGTANFLTTDYSLTINGAGIAGAAAVTLDKVDAGQLILPTANAYQGPTQIQLGWVTVENVNSLGTPAAGLGNGALPTTSVTAGAALLLRPAVNGGSLSLANNLVLAGSGIVNPFAPISQQGALESLDGLNTLTGTILLTGQVTLGEQLLDPGSFTDSTLTITGQMQDGASSGGITKVGDHYLYLYGPGTYTGNVDIQQGVVNLRNGTALGGHGTTTVEAGTTLELQGSLPQYAGGIAAGIQVWGETLLLNGTGDAKVGEPALINLNSDNMWRGNVTLANDLNLILNANSGLTIYGNISDAPNLGANGSALTVSGPGGGELTLAGNNTYRGLTTVTTGNTLIVQSSTALGSTLNGTIVKNGASLLTEGNLTIANEGLTIQGTGVATAPNVPVRWFNEGPAPILNGQTPSFTTPVSGIVGGLAVDPTDPKTIYLAGNGGGAWKTVDGGQSWVPLSDAEITNAGSVAVAPSNPNIVYLGTGNADNGLNDFYGTGVFMSADAGKDFTLLVNPDNSNPLYGLAVSKVVVDPANPNLIYVATSDMATNRPASAAGSAAVWRWNGTSWFNLTATVSAARSTGAPNGPNGAPPNTPGPDDDWRITFSGTTASYSDLFLSGANLIAAYGTWTGNTSTGVFRLTNPQTASAAVKPIWDVGNGALDSRAAEFPNGISGGGNNGNIQLAGNGATIYAAVTTPGVGGGLKALEKSVNNGVTWAAVAAPNYQGTIGNFDSTIAVDPNNVNNVYLAGQRQGAGLIYVEASTNGGAAWADISTIAGNGPVTEAHAFVVDSAGNALLGSAGGIWSYAANGAKTWTDLNGNLAITNFNSIAVNPTNANSAIGGSAENGTDLYSGAPAWTWSNQGFAQQQSAGVVLIDPLHPNIVYQTVNNPAPGFALQQSINSGTTWASLPTITSPTAYFPLVMDQVQTTRLVTATAANGLMESNNSGQTWASLENVPTSGYPATFVPLVLALSTYQNNLYDPNTIYAANDANGLGNTLYVTNNHGVTWTLANAGLPTGSISAIVVDPTNPNIAYAVYNSFGIHSVYKTSNGGTNWSPLGGNLPDTPVWTVVLDPRTGGLYVGTDLGVFASPDGINWTQLGVGLPIVSVHALQLNQTLDTLTAGTYGRGMFVLSLDGAAANAGALRDLSGTTTWNGPITLAGNTTIDVEGTQTLQNGIAAAQLNIVGAIGDSGNGFNVTKVGGGNLVYSGANTYDGATDVQAGVLVANNSLALGQFISAGSKTTVEDGAALEM
jgi:autotransporter-associated beta strand protein